MTSHLSFALLGDLEIKDGERKFTITAGKLRVMLAALLLRANQPVSHDELAVRLWDDRPPGTVRGTLHAYALRLRQALGDDRRAPHLILTRPQGYAILTESRNVDVIRFHSLLDGVRAGARTGDLAGEARELDEALHLWRGAALRDIASESLHRDVVPHLVEERLRAWERRLEIDLELGRHAGIVAELTALTSEYPLREGFWGHLMVALCRSGRQAEALETFRLVRRRFNHELGIDPGERLQRLHQNILAGRDPLSGRPRQSVTATAAAGNVAQLPAGVHGFTARSGEIATLRGWLAPSPANAAVTVVVISGAPGVGKSALALHVAHQLRESFPDGRFFVNLRGHSASPPMPPATALRHLLRQLGVPDDQIPPDQDDLEPMYRSLLGERRVLLMLDDAATAAQVRPLLPGRPGSVVIVTSRNDLRGLMVTQGGHRMPLPPLSPAESRLMLTRLIGAARVTAEPHAVMRLAELCTHLPLALRIAGVHLAANPRMGIGDYADRLQRYGRVAALDLNDDPESGLRQVFHASYARMPFEVKRHFLGLTSLLPPSFTVGAAARHLNTSPERIKQILDQLVSANLLRELSATGYAFNELIWEYGASLASSLSAPRAAAVADHPCLPWSGRVTTAAGFLPSFLYPSRPPRPRSARLP